MLTGAKVAIFYEITKGFSLFLSTLFPIFCEILHHLSTFRTVHPARFIDEWRCKWFIRMLFSVQKVVQTIHFF